MEGEGKHSERLGYGVYAQFSLASHWLGQPEETQFEGCTHGGNKVLLAANGGVRMEHQTMRSTRHDVDCSKIGVLEALAACFLERNGLGDAEGIGLEAQYVKVEYQNL
ncbi:hypothetical protein DEO72_LG4g439 [Vigna unguiculata]|uniref:Uncharacterized protein n=1 Tax=Vigna unguiculata TaxID=3917 RepID=A0A4D6LN89_VIGUN|nr:hypothetical protein DEO72_LG4g438 [Vigna unguiculata]QCD89494.1 hypothetical protein DEO72_LG4g439 [Vigna unguiculata]